jgi:hypothetical protein
MGRQKVFLWYNQLHQADTFLQKQTAAHLAFYETWRFTLLQSQQLTTRLYPKLFQSSLHHFV